MFLFFFFLLLLFLHPQAFAGSLYSAQDYLPEDDVEIADHLSVRNESSRSFRSRGSMRRASAFTMMDVVSSLPMPPPSASPVPKTRICINVSGRRFETYNTVFQRLPQCQLALLTPESPSFDAERNEYFLERNAACFETILSYFQTGLLHAPAGVCQELFFMELDALGIPHSCIAGCCRKAEAPSEFPTLQPNHNQKGSALTRLMDQYDQVKLILQEEGRKRQNERREKSLYTSKN